MEGVPNLLEETITREEPLGRGSFGEVFKCTWHGQPVAIKSFFQHNIDNDMVYEREALNLWNVRHPNIIQLYGVAVREHRRFIVMEYADNGSLHDFLHPEENPMAYLLDQALNWALQCAAGVAHLHSRTPILLHRDIKPLNLLLSDHHRRLKICDFGQVVELRQTMSLNRGSPRWTAPEVYQHAHYNEKCDVFSWGVIFWEILSREIPYGQGRSTNAIINAKLEGERPDVPVTWPWTIRTLIPRCWTVEPNNRPSMAEIVREMIAIKAEQQQWQMIF